MELQISLQSPDLITLHGSVVAGIFNFYIHRRFVEWWRKYNLVMAIGLDCGLAIAAIIIYFCVVYTGASEKIQVVGNNSRYSWL